MTEKMKAINVNHLVAVNIYNYRKTKSISQRELARKAGLTRGTIMHIENFKQRIFLDQATKISKALNVSLLDLVGDNE